MTTVTAATTAMKALTYSVLFLAIGSAAQKCSVCTKRGISMPISLAVGNVRTPEIDARKGYYNIHIDVKWLLPTEQLRCQMGYKTFYPTVSECSEWASLINLKWRVFDGDDVVAEGAASDRSTDFEADRESFTRGVGYFKAVAHHKYVVELTFLQDASALNVTQPRLTVEQPGFSF